MIEREKLQHLIENIGIPKLCLILLLGISLIIVSIPSGKTKKNAQSTETTAKEDSTDLYVKKQERRLVNALKHVEGVGKVKVMITVNSSKEAVVNKDSPYEQSSSEKEKTVKEDEQTILVEEDGKKVPYVIKEVEPVVEGVVVVAQGGGNDIIKNQIVEAKSCIEKYQKYAQQAIDPELKNLFEQLHKKEQTHYDSLTQVLDGTVPSSDCNDSDGRDYEPRAIYTAASQSEDKMHDAFLATDAIGTEKLVSGEYNTNVFMFGDSDLRKLMADIQVEEQNHAEMLYKYKTANGMQ